MDAEHFLKELTIARLVIEAMGKRLDRKNRAARKIIHRQATENQRLRDELLARMREDE